MSISFMALSSIIFALFPHQLVNIFTEDIELINISVPIVYLLACFQIFDGLQVSLAGVFKRIKKTKVVMLSNLFGYWIIAIPLGYTLAFQYNLGLRGFWIALISSAAILCLIMFIMMLKYFRFKEN